MSRFRVRYQNKTEDFYGDSLVDVIGEIHHRVLGSDADTKTVTQRVEDGFYYGGQTDLFAYLDSPYERYNYTVNEVIGAGVLHN